MAKDRRKLQHIHSSVVDKQPTPQTLEVGEIAVNNADKKEFLSIKSSQNKVVRFSSDEQMITWMEKKEVVPYVGQVRGDDYSATTTDMGSVGITNDDLLQNKSNIVIKMNQVAAGNTPKSGEINAATDIYGHYVNLDKDGQVQGAGFSIDMSRYAMIGANPSFSSLTVTDKTDLSGNTTITDGDGTGTRKGKTLTIKMTNENEAITTLNESATTRTTKIGTENLNVSGTTTEVHVGDVDITNEANVVKKTSGTTTETKVGNVTENTSGTTTIDRKGAVSENNQDNVSIVTSGNTTVTTIGNTVVESTAEGKSITIRETAKNGTINIQTNADSGVTNIQSLGSAGKINIKANESNGQVSVVGYAISDSAYTSTTIADNINVSGSTYSATTNTSITNSNSAYTSASTATTIVGTADTTVTSAKTAVTNATTTVGTADTTITSAKTVITTANTTASTASLSGKTLTVDEETSISAKTPTFKISGTTGTVIGSTELNLSGDTINVDAKTATTEVTSAYTTASTATTKIGTADASATTATLSGNTLEIKENTSLTFSGGTLTSTTTGDTTFNVSGKTKIDSISAITIQATNATDGDINIYAKDALTESGKTVDITATTSATTKAASAVTSAATTHITGSSAVKIYGGTIDETGTTITISGSTKLVEKAPTVEISGNSVNITGATSARTEAPTTEIVGSTKLNMSGATSTLSGTTTNIYGATNLNATGATVTVSGSTKLIEKAPTIEISGGTLSSKTTGNTTIEATGDGADVMVYAKDKVDITGDTVNISGTTTISGDVTIGGTLTIPITCNGITSSTFDDAICEVLTRDTVTMEVTTPEATSEILKTYKLYQNGAQIGVDINIPKDHLLKSAEIVYGKVNGSDFTACTDTSDECHWYIKLIWNVFDPSTGHADDKTTYMPADDFIKDIDDKNPTGVAADTSYNNVAVSVWYDGKQNWVSANTTPTIHAKDNVYADGTVSGATVQGTSGKFTDLTGGKTTLSGETKINNTLTVTGNTTLAAVTATTISASTSVKSPEISANTISAATSASIPTISATSVNVGDTLTATTISGVTTIKGTTISGGTGKFDSIECSSGLSKKLTWTTGNPSADTNGYNGSEDKTITIPSDISHITNGVSTARTIATASGLTGGGNLSADRTIGLATTGTSGTYGPSSDVTGSNGTTISVPEITTDEYGRVTKVTNRTYTSVDHTYTVNNGSFSVSGNGTSVASTSANASANTGVNIKAGSNVTVTANADNHDITIAATDTTYTFTDSNPTLAWNTKSKVGTVGGVDLHVTMPANPNTNTTYTIATGDSNGQIKVTPSTGEAYNVDVKGLGDAAYLGTGTTDGTVAAGYHTHNYAGSSTAGGAATSANKLNTDGGNATTPVYFSGGVPAACTYSLNKTVPSDAVFTDHYAWSDITGKPDSYTPSSHSHAISDVTDLQTALDGKSDIGHTHDDRYYTENESDGRFVHKTGDTMTGDLTVQGSIYQTSDERLKENIIEANYADMANANMLKIKKFNFIDDESKKPVYGVIAQEAEALQLNDVVVTKEDGMKAVDYTGISLLKIAYLEHEIKRLNDIIEKLIEDKQ